MNNLAIKCIGYPAVMLSSYGSFYGYRNCNWRKNPYVTERFACGVLTGVFFGFSVMQVPYECTMKIESICRKQSYDAAQYWKNLGDECAMSYKKF